MIFFWIVTMLCSCVASLVLISGVVTSKSSPQEAAVSAFAVALVVIPYVFTRCIEGMIRSGWHDKMLKTIERMAPPPR